jgi:sigma-E factor negative regulatory protein RseA
MEPDASAGVNVVEMNLSQESAKDNAAAREHLSAMADGELDDAVVGRACAAWHADASHRATWHAYHLIGDVMRSDDLASDAGRDAAFLGALRTRLATEPVVLAPEPLPATQAAAASHRSTWSWRVPTAVAAGFVAVAGVLVVTQGAGSLSGAPATPVLAQAQSQSLVPVAVAQRVAEPGAVALPGASAEPAVLIVNGQLIRDVQLDRYLSAHKQFAGSSALGVPSAFLRSATADAASR